MANVTNQNLIFFVFKKNILLFFVVVCSSEYEESMKIQQKKNIEEYIM